MTLYLTRVEGLVSMSLRTLLCGLCEGACARAQSLSPDMRCGWKLQRGKHSLAPCGVGSTDPGSDLSPEHSLCVSNLCVNWRPKDSGMFSQQWGRGAESPGVQTWLPGSTLPEGE